MITAQSLGELCRCILRKVQYKRTNFRRTCVNGASHMRMAHLTCCERLALYGRTGISGAAGIVAQTLQAQ